MARSWCSRLAWLMLLSHFCLDASVAPAQLWRHFLPIAGAKNAAPAEIVLAQENGPWLIMAASFSGEGAEQQAQDLVQELRSRYRLAAYKHEVRFNLADGMPGRGLDEYGAPIRRRYRRGEEIREIAVLVGDFPSVDDPDAQQTLERIKTLQPNALAVDATESAQTLAQFRRFEDSVLEKFGKTRQRGPMGQAFLTRNPLLPREFFVPKGVDPFVAKMNDGVKHSLLDARGRYSIQVASFRGKTLLQTSSSEDQAKSFWGRPKKNDRNPLVEAAENAHLLTEKLRAHGWEAYEFHDRTESIVTIGTFAQVAQQLPDGRVVPIPEVDRIMRTFGAAYDTPPDPLNDIGNDPATQRRVDEQEQAFNMRMQNHHGQVVPGLNPKHVKIFSGSGKKRRLERIIPMDVHPQAIEVPQRSISGAYARQ